MLFGLCLLRHHHHHHHHLRRAVLRNRVAAEANRAVIEMDICFFNVLCVGMGILELSRMCVNECVKAGK